MTAPVMTACDYAACTRLAETFADGWAFCCWHIHEHRKLCAKDRQTAAANGPRTTASPVEHILLSSKYQGQRQPSQSWAPLLDVLRNPHRPGQSKPLRAAS